jgi:hypothetical protein
METKVKPGRRGWGDVIEVHTHWDDVRGESGGYWKMRPI